MGRTIIVVEEEVMGIDVDPEEDTTIVFTNQDGDKEKITKTDEGTGGPTFAIEAYGSGIAEFYVADIPKLITALEIAQEWGSDD